MIYRHQGWGMLTVPGSIPSSQEQWISDITSQSVAYSSCVLSLPELRFLCSPGTERETRLGAGEGCKPTVAMHRDGEGMEPSVHFLRAASSHPPCCVSGMDVAALWLIISVLRMELRTWHLLGKCSTTQPCPCLCFANADPSHSRQEVLFTAPFYGVDK